MFSILITTILVSAFFICFLNRIGIQKQRVIKEVKKLKVSTTDGFVEDTDDAFIMPRYPTQLIKKDQTGKINQFMVMWVHL